MPSFTSNRERRLWLWTLAVVVAIYSTLGLARTLADEIRNEGLTGAVFGAGMLMILAAIVLQSLRARAGGLEVGIWIGTIAVYLMIFSRMAIAEERTHLIEYSVVALLILEALRERASNGRPAPAAPLLAFAAASAIGLVDELVQGALPNRVFDPIDIGFNALAAAMAVTASTAIVWARGRVAAHR